MSKYSLLVATALLLNQTPLLAQLARETPASPSSEVGAQAISALSNILDKYVDSQGAKAEAPTKDSSSDSAADRQNLELKIHKQERLSRTSIDYFVRSRAPKENMERALKKYEAEAVKLLDETQTLAGLDAKASPLLERAKNQLAFIRKTMSDYGFASQEASVSPSVSAVETEAHKAIRAALTAESTKLEKAAAFFASRPAQGASFARALEGASKRAEELLKRAEKLGSDSVSLKLVADIKDYQASILVRHAQANPATAPAAMAAAQRKAEEAQRVEKVADIKAASEAVLATPVSAEADMTLVSEAKAQEPSAAVETEAHKAIRAALTAESTKLEKAAAFFASRPAQGASFARALEGASKRAEELLKRAEKLGSDSVSLKLVADIKDYQASILVRHAQANPATAPAAMAAAQRKAEEAQRVEKVADIKAASEAVLATPVTADVAAAILPESRSVITASSSSDALAADLDSVSSGLASADVVGSTVGTVAPQVTTQDPLLKQGSFADGEPLASPTTASSTALTASVVKPVSEVAASSNHTFTSSSVGVTEDILRELGQKNRENAELKTQVITLETAARKAQEMAETLASQLRETESKLTSASQQKEVLESKVQDLGDKIETAAKVFRAITQD